MSTLPTIAIVGGGFAGTLTAVHLLRARPAQPIRLVLIERRSEPGRGVAYGTKSDAHWLNVPAGRMSAFPDDADHFVRWARERDPKVAGGDFLLRRTYGDYVADVLSHALAERSAGIYFETRNAAVLDLERDGDGARLLFSDGPALRADRVVLALGNFPPADPPAFRACPRVGSRYIRDPWGDGALDRVEDDATVLLLGTRLTMIDAALELRARGHRGPLIAISRHGLLPQPHRTPAKPPLYDPPLHPQDLPRTARGLLSVIRKLVRDAQAAGVDWREPINDLRPITAELWQALSVAERARFVRHVQPFWETHRHRTPPPAARLIEELLKSRALHVLAGHVTEFHEEHGGALVELRRRGSSHREKLRVGFVVNCTGPQRDVGRVADPLVVNLLRRGLISPDELRIGLRVDAEGRIVEYSGRASEALFTLGSPRAAQLWESTAVPELRMQAAALAATLLASLNGAPGAQASRAPEVLGARL